ncbi:30S ribosomal protein S1 [Desulfonema limicola]|uniref:30S ribosomal protein S1 n=1 Tax=Desulfonema limicola TaxID=45656 RepID=A0A975BEY9_9BACT|nr:30S ribosomal protein S1 [Desulfonema limicola]QTA83919.1 30S ribosomal protein S1 [Desulfonema limicola]
MSDNLTTENNENEEENFADLFESYNTGMNEDLQVGDMVKGEIISIGMDSVFVNTGTKIDGAVDKAELLDENGEMTFSKGDILELYVVAFNENEMRLSKALSGAGGINLLQDAYEGRVPVEGRVTEQCKGGFRVEIMQQKAFCPVSQIDIRYVEKPEIYVGENLEFLITRFEENGRNIVVSRRELLSREQEKAKKTFLGDVEPGAVLEGKITNIMPYGAFVELFPGIEGMVHISEFGWSRVENPEDVLKKDETVKVKVLGIEKGKKKGQLKISLSMKQVTGDPWDDENQAFRAGDKVKGRVTRLMDFGAFVEIVPGIEGLVHISEMSYTKRILKAGDVVQPGEMIDVMIKDIDMGSRRISLSIRDAEGDPWINIADKFTIGQKVEGIVEKKEKFGYFITLEPGITGLLPKSKISGSENSAVFERLKPGDTVKIVIEEIHPDTKKISLGTGDEKQTDDWKKYAKVQDNSVSSSSSASSGESGLGSFGELLQEAMKKGKK